MKKQDKIKFYEEKIKKGTLLDIEEQNDQTLEFFAKHNAKVREQVILELLNFLQKHSKDVIELLDYIDKVYGITLDKNNQICYT